MCASVGACKFVCVKEKERERERQTKRDVVRERELLLILDTNGGKKNLSETIQKWIKFLKTKIKTRSRQIPILQIWSTKHVDLMNNDGTYVKIT